jgi:RNA recognition motif-containing protein
MIKLFIVGIPRDMDETELTEIFTPYGEVASVKIITEQESGISKGYGFINMLDTAGAGRAIEALDGASIDERTISVRIADDKQPDTQNTQKSNDFKPKFSNNRGNFTDNARPKGKRPRKTY